MEDIGKIIGKKDKEAFLSALRRTPAPNQALGQAIAGGTWVHYVAEHYDAEVLQAMVDAGFDPNERGTLVGELPIVYAASAGRLDNVRFLLACGNVVDTDDPVRNPLWATIHGAAQPHSKDGDQYGCAKTLLETGMDAAARYRMSKKGFYNAAEWAALYGNDELADLIGSYIDAKPS